MADIGVLVYTAAIKHRVSCGILVWYKTMSNLRKRRKSGVFGAIGRVVARTVFADMRICISAWRLVVGLLLVVSGLLAFASDRYCDGTASAYYACTNPSTYYYYPWWAIMLTAIGVVLCVLWFLRAREV